MQLSCWHVRLLAQVGRLGIGICYDIRFPEMAQLYAARGVQLIVYPGAWQLGFGALPPAAAASRPALCAAPHQSPMLACIYLTCCRLVQHLPTGPPLCPCIAFSHWPTHPARRIPSLAHSPCPPLPHPRQARST